MSMKPKDWDWPEGGPLRDVHNRSAVWTVPELNEIHAKAELGRYQVRGWSTFQHNFPDFHDLVFVPACMTRLPLEGYRENCSTRTVFGGGRPDLVSQPIELDIPVYVSSMSFGALGTNAKMAIGRGSTIAGSMTCTGEGGMLPEERDASKTLVYQMTPSRYMLDLDQGAGAGGRRLCHCHRGYGRHWL